MKIQKISAVESNVSHIKKNQVKNNENNISFTGSSSLKKVFVSLPLVLASLGVTASANAAKTQNDITNVETDSIVVRAPQQNEVGTNVRNDILIISDLPKNVQQFIKDNNMDIDKNGEMSLTELDNLCNEVNNKANEIITTHPFFTNQTYQREAINYTNNIMNVVQATSNVYYKRNKDQLQFDIQKQNINELLETFNEKNNIVFNKEEQIEKMDSYIDGIKNKYTEYSNQSKARCIGLDTSLFNLAKSMQNPNSTKTLDRDDYNYCYDLWQSKIESRVNNYVSTLNGAFKKIKNNLQYNNLIGARKELSELIRYITNYKNSIQQYNVTDLQNVCLSKVQEYLRNGGELNSNQLDIYSSIFNDLSKQAKESEADKKSIQDLIDNLTNQYEQIELYMYKPSDSSLDNISKAIESNYTDFVSRYDKMIDSYSKFNLEEETNLNNITTKVKNNKDGAISSYSNITKTFNNTLNGINTNSTNLQDIYNCNQLLLQLDYLNKASNQSMYQLEIDGLEFMVEAINKYNIPAETVNVKSVDGKVMPNNSQPIKVIRDKKVVIEKAVPTSDGQYKVQQTGIDGKLK